MVYELQRSPLRKLYILLHKLETYVFRIPLWYLKSIPRPLRPRASWSATKAYLMPYLNYWHDFGPIGERVGPMHSWPDYRAIPDTPGVKAVWLDSTPQLVVGDVKQWAERGNVQPIRIPGYWYDKDGHDTPIGAPPEPGEKVVLYLHGGGLITESAHPSNFMSVVPLSIMRHCSAKRALSVEYRLVELSPEANPFPAALFDCLAGYHYLVDVLGFSPDSIIVAGDSAGGLLTLTLARYLIDNLSELSTRLRVPPSPPASALVLLSPWCDLGTSHETPGSSLVTFSYDFMPDQRKGLVFAARQAYLRSLPPDSGETNPYVSPASRHPECHASFKGFPRTFVTTGGAERLLDQDRTLVEYLRRDLGPDSVVYYEATDALHDYIHFPQFPQEAAETQKMLKALEAFLE